MSVILTASKPAAITADRGTGRVLVYRIVLGGYEEISSPDGAESWTEFVTYTETVAVPDCGPFTPVNHLIDLEVADRFPGYVCIEATYRGATTRIALEAEFATAPF